MRISDWSSDVCSSDLLSRLSGMPIDPATMQTMMRHLQGAFASGDDGISWDLAKRQALHIANQGALGITTGQRTDLEDRKSGVKGKSVAVGVDLGGRSNI